MGHEWKLNQQNRIAFVMVDAAGSEVAGLGGGFTLELSKNGAGFAGSAGAKAEIGDGWYTYLSTAAEANTPGVVAVKVTGAGAAQQNLEYVVESRPSGAIAYTYTVTNSVSGLPVEGVEVWITTDLAGNNVVWNGDTDAFGVARDDNGNLPRLDAGSYYFWKQRAGLIDDQNPDTEVVS